MYRHLCRHFDYIYGGRFVIFLIILFIMSMQQCSSCNLVKSLDEYNANKTNGELYSKCKLCFHNESVKFWSDKKFRICKSCDVNLPLRKYDRANEIPYRECRKCYETKVATYTRERRERALANVKIEPTTQAIPNNTTQGVPLQPVSQGVRASNENANVRSNNGWKSKC